MNAAQPLPLKDIHLPPSPPWWPPAPGWWVLAGVVFVLALWAGGRWLRHRRRLKWRRAVLAELEALRREYVPGDGAAYAENVSALLRRVALARYRRDEVAALSGDAWLAFLDRHGGGDAFRRGPGRVLGDALYRPRLEVDPDALTQVARDWIEKNLEGPE